MNNEKLPHLVGPDKQGYYRFQTSASAGVARRVSAVLVKIKARFPHLTMAAAWRESTVELGELWVAQAKIDHALEILKSRHFADENHTAAPFVLDVIKALTGCPTDTTVEFTGESEEYKKFWERDSDQNSPD